MTDVSRYVCCRCGESFEKKDIFILTVDFLRNTKEIFFEKNSRAIYICEPDKKLLETFFTYGKFDFKEPKLIVKEVAA